MLAHDGSIEAVQHSHNRKNGDMRRRKEKSQFREYAESIIFAIVLAIVMRQFVVQAFKIPSGSMEETLLIGDHILVNKFLYHFTSPERFDVIVFKYPWEDDRDFIKRVIALPGDRVQVRNKVVYVNEQPLQEPYAQYTALHGRDENFGPVVIPKKGDTIEIREDKQLYLNGELIPIPPGRFYPRDHGAALTGFEVFYGALFPAGITLQQSAGPFVVEHDYYFTLGDNRDNSKDSRYWGFVQDRRIRGKAFFIYWSWNRNGNFVDHVRWDRLGKLLELTPSGSFALREKTM
jgi:signal peptidase I